MLDWNIQIISMKLRNLIKRLFSRRSMLVMATLLVSGLIYFIFCLPNTLFDSPTSTVIFDRDGKLLSARIASDGQWRFPPCDSIPHKFEVALVEFEDRKFHSHSGVHLPSIMRAIKQNVSNGHIVSGGSTISMQVIRMSRGNPKRTIFEKCKEMVKALRLETRFDKNEILQMYASNAPMGGNVVGLDAASWRYYGRNAHDLSWGEAATLAVLPNAPSLIYPGKNQQKLMDKRNRLLDRLHESGEMDSITCVLSKLEPLPQKPAPLPQECQHLLHHISKKHSGEAVQTTVDASLQHRVLEVMKRHNNALSSNQIQNLAALIIDVEKGEVLAYVGNMAQGNHHGAHVDVIQAPRSTGSILKPILYAGMLDQGELLPHTLISDVPTYMAGYAPKNFDENFAGAVPASQALYKSLNVPAVLMLKKFGIEKFHHLLGKLGMKHINRPPEHYGLTLILGGAEASLWDITNAYAGMSKTLGNFKKYNSRYNQSDFDQVSFIRQEDDKETYLTDDALINAGAIYKTYESLLNVNRPTNETGWESFSSSHKVAWKTGTSFGFRDAWAVGTTPKYVIGVWAGNADGEGRPGITGVTAAAPVLFDLFDLLPQCSWFDAPYDDLMEVQVCGLSGHRAGLFCDETESELIPIAGNKTSACPYHQRVHLDAASKYRVSSQCEEPEDMVQKSWFVLPSIQEWYYRKTHPEYKPLPDWQSGCAPSEEGSPLAIVYPNPRQKIYVPKEFSGKRGKAVLKATHRHADTEIHWHLGSTYIGTTKTIHQVEVNPEPGIHELVLMDEHGYRQSRMVEFIQE
jgi:penicillin-binding protein 1C